MDDMVRMLMNVKSEMTVVLIVKVYVGKRDTSFNKNALTLIVGAFYNKVHF